MESVSVRPDRQLLQQVPLLELRLRPSDQRLLQGTHEILCFETISSDNSRVDNRPRRLISPVTLYHFAQTIGSLLTIILSKPAAETTKAPTTPEGAVKVPRSQIFEERAKKISERFGIEITPSEWHSSEGHALRVEKPIRMRVHRECHKCGHNFGLAKECPNCKHHRCKECQRRPAKRSEAERAESRKKRAAAEKERAENPPIIADWDLSSKKITLTRPAKQGGQDLVHKKPRQRVRRTCCQCSSLFHGAEKSCPGCQHARCTDCPRDP